MSKITVTSKIVSFPTSNVTLGNLALKPVPVKPIEYETPKILKLVIGKKKNNIFCGCWQVANQEDAC